MRRHRKHPGWLRRYHRWREVESTARHPRREHAARGPNHSSNARQLRGTFLAHRRRAWPEDNRLSRRRNGHRGIPPRRVRLHHAARSSATLEERNLARENPFRAVRRSRLRCLYTCLEETSIGILDHRQSRLIKNLLLKAGPRPPAAPMSLKKSWRKTPRR